MYDPLRAKAKIALYTGATFLAGLGLASGLGWTQTSIESTSRRAGSPRWRSGSVVGTAMVSRAPGVLRRARTPFPFSPQAFKSGRAPTDSSGHGYDHGVTQRPVGRAGWQSRVPKPAASGPRRGAVPRRPLGEHRYHEDLRPLSLSTGPHRSAVDEALTACPG